MEKRENADINIVLVGLDYNYSLEVGKMLASQLEMYFLDSQGLYEFDIRPKTMEDIINEMGMDYFRKAQCGTIKYICSFTSSILVVESGALMNEDNVNKLDKYGLIVYIHQDQETLRQLYQSQDNLSDIKKSIYLLKADEIINRDEKLKIVSEIIVNDENEPIRCTAEIIKGIKNYYGVE